VCSHGGRRLSKARHAGRMLDGMHSVEAARSAAPGPSAATGTTGVMCFVSGAKAQLNWGQPPAESSQGAGNEYAGMRLKRELHQLRRRQGHATGRCASQCRVRSRVKLGPSHGGPHKGQGGGGTSGAGPGACLVAACRAAWSNLPPELV